MLWQLTSICERHRERRAGFALGGDPTSAPALLNDASLYLQALERGGIVLTRNLRDFDYIDQILPAGRLLFYERA